MSLPPIPPEQIDWRGAFVSPAARGRAAMGPVAAGQPGFRPRAMATL